LGAAQRAGKAEATQERLLSNGAGACTLHKQPVRSCPPPTAGRPRGRHRHSWQVQRQPALRGALRRRRRAAAGLVPGRPRRRAAHVPGLPRGGGGRARRRLCSRCAAQAGRVAGWGWVQGVWGAAGRLGREPSSCCPSGPKVPQQRAWGAGRRSFWFRPSFWRQRSSGAAAAPFAELFFLCTRAQAAPS
jgi:hypothetical protein